MGWSTFEGLAFAAEGVPTRLVERARGDLALANLAVGVSAPLDQLGDKLFKPPSSLLSFLRHRGMGKAQSHQTYVGIHGHAH